MVDPQLPIHPLQHSQGGVILSSNGEGVKQVRTVIKSFLSSAYSQIKQGQFPDLFRSVKPCALNAPHSIMQCVALDFQYLDHYLNKYMSLHPLPHQQDYVSRLQHIVTAMLAGQHCTSVLLGPKAPIDSTLGETITLSKPSATSLSFETISTTPHTQLYQMSPPPHSPQPWKAEGSIQIAVSINPITNKVLGRRHGSNLISIGGDIISFVCSPMEISGLLGGDMVSYYVEKYTFVDHTRMLLCEVTYNPEYTKKTNLGKFTSGLKGLFAKNKERMRDDMSIEICQYIKTDKACQKGPVIIKGSGNWMSHIKWEETIWWKVTDVVEEFTVDESIGLASDFYLRKDVQMIQEGDIKSAQAERDIHEAELERDKKLRKSYKQNKQ